MAVTLRKSVQIVSTGLYVKNSSQNYAKRSLGSGTDNYFASSFTDVNNTLNGLGESLGTTRVNRTFVVS